MRTNYEQYIIDYFASKKSNDSPHRETINAIRDELASLGRECKKLDWKVFLAALKVSCLQEKYGPSTYPLVAEAALRKRITLETIFSYSDSILEIMKDCKDPGFIDNYVTEICQAWTDEASRAELLRQYNIPPRKQIIQAKLAAMNGPTSASASSSFFAAPNTSPTSGSDSSSNSLNTIPK
jgi:hypothetical protein